LKERCVKKEIAGRNYQRELVEGIIYLRLSSRPAIGRCSGGLAGTNEGGEGINIIGSETQGHAGLLPTSFWVPQFHDCGRDIIDLPRPTTHNM